MKKLKSKFFTSSPFLIYKKKHNVRVEISWGNSVILKEKAALQQAQVAAQNIL